MKITLLLLSFFGLIWAVNGKLGFLNDEGYKKIEELANYLRKRTKEAEAASLKFKNEEEDSEDQNEPSEAGGNPSFVFSFPNVKPQYTKDPTFAVDPSDPRYYQDYVRIVKPPQSANEENRNWKETQTATQTVPDERSREESSEGDDESSPNHSDVHQSPIWDVTEADDKSDIYFTALVAGCSAAVVFGVVAIGISCYRLQKNAKAAAEVDYPAYGVTGPHKDASPTSGDRRLAQSAQMYHYQHQKQQIIAMESRASNERHGSISDAESDEENEEGDYTVYECPGLASTGEMEVKNPLFHDDQTPATPVNGSAKPSSKQAQELPK